VENKLELKSITQLFKYKFFIPAYQRGYRWKVTQVEQLLDDIRQFSQKDREKGEFYCLQPIVVKQKDDEYEVEVIDGQQRLTTIFLIIKYLEEIMGETIKIYFKNAPVLPPSYDTRKKSSEFLNNIKSKKDEEASLNIDYFYIKKAYDKIKNWFESSENSEITIDFVNTLLKSEKNVRVIWYEIIEDKSDEDKTDDSINIFTRLNIGKIPLTNAELIKALFLQKENFITTEKTNLKQIQIALKQIQIASEWDTIEKTLQDDAFWFFIYNIENPLQYDNRIEYIFDLMKERTKESEYYYTFNRFFKEYSESKKDGIPDIDAIWLRIKEYFMTFEEWFKDYELFHNIGYLIACIEGNETKYTQNIINTINTLKDKSRGITKIQFKDHLKEEIKKQVNFKIKELNYKNDKDKTSIRKVLLLFNIQTVLETQKSDIEALKAYMRFPFHKYKSEKWDIEHVRSQNDNDNIENDEKKREEWVRDIFELFTGSNDEAEIRDYISKYEISEDKDEKDIKEICDKLLDYREETDKKQQKEKFKSIYKLVQNFFKESKVTDKIHTISNLALLDEATNRSYGNAFFPIKRRRIINNDKRGIFVPLCTKNLFLKYYSKKFGKTIMYWEKDDADDYLKAIEETLKDFLPKDTKPAVEVK